MQNRKKNNYSILYRIIKEFPKSRDNNVPLGNSEMIR